jgi:diguanylate cyclase (GGDEF)-like protein/putative nucleotidyltransferase with HDIG domain/PAS domain S-box-containing protein
VQSIETLIPDSLNLLAGLTNHDDREARSAAESSRLLVELIALSEVAQSTSGPDNGALEGIVSPLILRKLLAALHFRDSATVNHSRRVSQLAVGIAKHLRWEGVNLRQLEIAALLHDVGKIGVPDNVLFKPGKLNADEADLMALHHSVSVDVLQAAHVDPQVIEIVSQSRDFSCAASKGVGRTPGALHQGARILSVADAYDSLRTDQVYRQAKSHDEAMKILVENTGTQFDGNVINALTRWATTSGIARAGYVPQNQAADASGVFSDPQEARDADRLSRIFSHLYLLENLYDGFYIVDSDQKFRVWSDGARRLVGQPAENLIEHLWTSRTICYAEADGRELLDDDLPLRKAVETRQPQARNVRILNAAGNWSDVELQSVPLIDSSGRLRGVAEILRDRSRSELAPREHRDMQLAASRDALTGVANQAELKSQLGRLLEAANRDDWKVPFSVIVVDVDHFKQINDRFGRATGDLVLIEAARVLQQETYSGEIVGRQGGGQFMILCPATSGEQAAKRAERIRIVLARVRLEELEEWPLTGSFGVTQAVPGDTVDNIPVRADKALYSATHGGRNQTFYLSPTDHSEPLLRERENGTGGRFEYEAQFLACTAAEMIVYKLGGFVTERDAELLEVTTDRVRMRLGRRTLFSRWGKTDETRPVDIELDFGTEVPLRDVNGRKVKSNQIQVSVKILPVGRVKSRDMFLERATQVLKGLSTYFLAEV